MVSEWFQFMVSNYDWKYLLDQTLDKIIPTPSGAETIEESDIWRHLVFLRSNNEEIGVVGLLQYVKPGSGPQGTFLPKKTGGQYEL